MPKYHIQKVNILKCKGFNRYVILFFCFFNFKKVQGHPINKTKKNLLTVFFFKSYEEFWLILLMDCEVS